MANYMYLISVLTYAGILIFLLINDVRVKKHPDAVEKKFRLMATWVILFCLQDCFWGLCDSKIISGTGAFYVASTLFHGFTIVTTFFWMYYILIYVGISNKVKWMCILLHTVIFAFEIAMLIVNLFTPVIFSVADGKYTIGPLRSVTFINQYVVYLLIGIIAYVGSLRLKKKDKTKAERFRYVFIATMAPILLGMAQLFYPHAPFHSLGYFLGCFIIHTLVVTKEREEKEKAGVYAAVADTLYSLHIVDLENDSIDRLIEPKIITKLIGEETDAQKIINKAIVGASREEYHDILLEFVDFSTLSERLKEKKHITCEFVGKWYGWTRITFVSIAGEDNVIKKVAVTTQIIDSEKSKQIELIYLSTTDELTGAYNRRAYEKDMDELDRDAVIVAMDLNGLKNVNDSLGHEAGDELLTGASDCMKKSMQAYGKIYRTGGDEFVAILLCEEQRIDSILDDFRREISNWSGKLVKRLSISYGWAYSGEFPNSSLRKTASVADRRMYEAKETYYQNLKGMIDSEKN